MLTRSLHPDERLLILGAGPTGLGAAFRLRELGHEAFLVVDSADRVGGLARSYTDAHGFTWDIGGHVQFSHYAYFDALMDLALGDNWLLHNRESWIWIEERFVPYPLQNNLHRLTPATAARCLQGLKALQSAPRIERPANFGEWIDASFGKGLAEVFLRPYNAKVWAYPPEELDYAWVGERVAVPDLERIERNMRENRDDVSWGPNNQFRFPLRGGTGAIWEAVADLVGRERIHLNRCAVEIDAQSRKVHFADGSTEAYDALLTTIPLDNLAHSLGIEALKEAARRLRYSSTYVIGVGLEGQPPPHLQTKCWMYFPECNCPFYRVTLFSNYSPNNVPDINRHWSLMAEVASSPRRPVKDHCLVHDVLNGMLATRLIESRDQVCSIWTFATEHGYPTPALGRDEALAAAHSVLEPLRIYARGRFGGWKYEVSNQDHSVMQGVELVNRLLLGVPEITYRYPNIANAPGYGR
jgi:protoporphyrinogen oxidase